MEGSVEAGHGRDVRKAARYGVKRGERHRLVEGREVGERPQSPRDVGVDQYRIVETIAPVDDAAADRVRLGELGDRGLQFISPPVAVERAKVVLRLQRVVLTKEPQFEAARARVDDEDSHAGRVLRVGGGVGRPAPRADGAAR